MVVLVISFGFLRNFWRNGRPLPGKPAVAPRSQSVRTLENCYSQPVKLSVGAKRGTGGKNNFFVLANFGTRLAKVKKHITTP